MEESMVSKTFLKVVGVAGCLMLTIFAGLFALMSISCLVVSIIEKDIMSVIGCLATGFIAWVTWSIRKDTLV